MVLEVAVAVFVDVGVVENGLIVLNTRKGVPDLALTRAERFNVRSLQNDARFEGFQDVIIPARFGIAKNVGHTEATWRKPCFLAEVPAPTAVSGVNAFCAFWGPVRAVEVLRA